MSELGNNYSSQIQLTSNLPPSDCYLVQREHSFWYSSARPKENEIYASWLKSDFHQLLCWQRGLALCDSELSDKLDSGQYSTVEWDMVSKKSSWLFIFIGIFSTFPFRLLGTGFSTTLQSGFSCTCMSWMKMFQVLNRSFTHQQGNLRKKAMKNMTNLFFLPLRTLFTLNSKCFFSKKHQRLKHTNFSITPGQWSQKSFQMMTSQMKFRVK